MKIVVGIIFLLAALACVCYGILWSGYLYPKDFNYSLRLANDASLPGQKAYYLGEYLDRVSTISGPPRYVFMTPDKELGSQRLIIEGLITRFEDVAKLPSSEMAYQQGMAQLNDEVEHQLGRIEGIFKSAQLRSSGFRFTIIFWGWLIFGFAAFVAFLSDESFRDNIS